MDSELKKAVHDVCRAAEGLKLDIVLVGALMAELTPEISPDYPRFRRTNDADFGVYVRDWPAYQKLREKLLRQKFDPNPNIEHRLSRGTAIVDLIPYGSQIAPGGKVVWPESEFEMTVVGFDEVCAAAYVDRLPGIPPMKQYFLSSPISNPCSVSDSLFGLERTSSAACALFTAQRYFAKVIGCISKNCTRPTGKDISSSANSISEPAAIT